MKRRHALKQTGAIWSEEPENREAKILSVCSALERTYGNPRHGNPVDALDDLIFIILSNKTTPSSAKKAFDGLRAEFATWQGVTSAPIKKIRDVIRPAGLGVVKSHQIRAALRRIESELGGDLSILTNYSEAQAEEYLVSLPGVSKKVAKCVMMYTLGFSVLPVDVHVHRVATRLGWTARKRADQSHEELEALVPAAWRASFHVTCVAHGRATCRPHPECQVCPVAAWCEYYTKHNGEVSPRSD